MRINNYISSTGYCSRREADQLILQKRVKVNGEPATIGQQVSETDRVEIDGVLIQPQTQLVYVVLNKPLGIICTTDQQIKNNIVDYVNHPQRIFPIGRLDKDSQGLILLTNDGSVVNKILDEKNNVEKEYLVKVDKELTKDFINQMQQGVEIYNPVKNQHQKTKPTSVKAIDAKTFQLTLTQGLNRQIRRMTKQLGYQVTHLKRIRLKNIKLKTLGYGKWRHLSAQEIEELLNGLESF